MKYNKLVFSLFMVMFSFSATAENDVGFESIKFKNDKETRITVLGKREARHLNSNYRDRDIFRQIEERLYSTLEIFSQDYGENLCDLALAREIDKSFSIREDTGNVNLKGIHYSTQIKLARINNSIDDIFFDILKNIPHDILLLVNAQEDKRIPSYNTSNNRVLKTNDLEKLYEDFKVWPDNITTCTLEAYNELIQNIADKKDIKQSDLLILHKEAYNQGYISLATFQKLKVLPKLKMFKHPITVKKYFDLIQKTKNILIPENTGEREEDIQFPLFPSQIINKRSRLTRRKSLYYKYSKNQIVMLAQVLRKSARRIGADPDFSLSRAHIELRFEYEINEDSQRNYVEVYELSTQDQYSLARKLLRNDMRNLAQMKSFAAKNLNYKDIIMAALETGYITHVDIEQVLKYDDIFNPKRISPWNKFKKFSTEIMGRSTLFLPAPFNIVGSIAIILIESFVKKPTQNGAYHENSSSLIN